MNKKCYIVATNRNDPDEEIFWGVFSTREKAQKAIDDNKSAELKKGFAPFEYTIEEVDFDSLKLKAI